MMLEQPAPSPLQVSLFLTAHHPPDSGLYCGAVLASSLGDPDMGALTWRTRDRQMVSIGLGVKDVETVEPLPGGPTRFSGVQFWTADLSGNAGAV
jgi:hypothetical protein